MKDEILQGQSKPLIIYIDDDGSQKKTYSNFRLYDGGTIEFDTQQNTIVIPVSRLIKIKMDRTNI